MSIWEVVGKVLEVGLGLRSGTVGAGLRANQHDGPGVAPPGVAPDVPTKLTHPYPRATGNITRTFTLSCHSAVQSDSPHHATHAGKSGADQALVAEQPSTHAGKHTQDSHAGKQTRALHTAKRQGKGV